MQCPAETGLQGYLERGAGVTDLILINRLPFFIKRGILTAVLFSLVCVSELPAGEGAKESKKDPNEYWQKQIEKFEKKYRLTVDYKKLFYNYSGINGEKALDSELAVYVPLLLSEFSIYPAELFKSSKLKKVILCRNMKNDQNKKLGYALFMPAYNAFFQNVGELDNINYIRMTVHHEFFHSLDDLGTADDEWQKLNSPGFEYYCSAGVSEEFINMIRRDREQNKPFPGFITRYSQANMKEDKAEVFCHLVFYPEVLKKKCSSDPVLTEKVRYLKALLKKKCGELDELFWERAEKREVWKMNSCARGEYYQYTGDKKNALKYFLRAAGEEAAENPVTDEFYTVEWYKNSSELAKTLAGYEAGRYLLDAGGKANIKKAVSFLQKSAERGYVESQIFLGHMYEQGIGVEKDTKEAKKWYSLAEKQGSREATELLNKLLFTR